MNNERGRTSEELDTLADAERERRKRGKRTEELVRREARARHQHLRNIARGQFARLSQMHANLLELAELAAMSDRPVPEAALRLAREQYDDLLGAADDAE